ncbi:MAG: hypothetical protein H7246_07920 [Phycisphaerae bacterium]|nr:hypothetical protein [Saprospiraceae bacterium]
MPYSKQDLKNLVANGHTAAVLAATLTATSDLRDTGIMNRSVALLSARWSANEQARQRGTVSNADYLLEKNKVIDALLLIVDQIPVEALEGHLPENLVPIYSESEPSSKPSDLWKKLGYVGLIIGILAGVVKIVEYFQKPAATIPVEQSQMKPDSLATSPNISTSGDQSPAINAPGGDVQINYGGEAEKPIEKKLKKQ